MLSIAALRTSQLTRTDPMDIDFVAATLKKYGLADRFDAGEVTQRSDSTDRAIRYVSRVRRSSHQLRLDDWKRLGRDQMGQKCGRGWQGLRGACKRVPKGGDKDAAIKASKVALADKIRARKGMSDRNAPNVKDVAPNKVNPLSENRQRVLKNDLNHFIGAGRGFLDSDRGDGPSQRRQEAVKKAVANNDTESLDRLAKQIYYSSAGGENKREFPTTGAYVKAFKKQVFETFSAQITPKGKTNPTPVPTSFDRLVSKVERRNLRLSGEVIPIDASNASKLERIQKIQEGVVVPSRNEEVKQWKQKQKKRQEHLAKFKAERDAKRSKKILDRRQNEKVKQNDKDRIAKNPLLHAVRGVADPDRQIATRRRLEEAVRTGSLNGAEIQRIAKTVGLQKKEQKALAIELTGIGALKKKESTKGTENKFRDEILKGRDRVAGTRPNDVIAAGAKLGMNETESWATYKRLSESESIARRAARAKREEQFSKDSQDEYSKRTDSATQPVKVRRINR